MAPEELEEIKLENWHNIPLCVALIKMAQRLGIQ